MNERSLVADIESTARKITDEDLGLANNVQYLDEGSEEYKRGKKLRDLMVDQLMITQETNEELEQRYGGMVQEGRNKRAELNIVANRTGKEKLRHDFFGSYKREAKAQLKEINRKQREYNAAKAQETQDAEKYQRKLVKK